MTQLSLLDLSDPVPASRIKIGHFFLRGNVVFMRVKPTGYMLNSNLVVDCINRNKIFVVNMETGTFYTVKGEEEVEPTKLRITCK